MQFDPEIGSPERSVASLEDYLEAIRRRRLLVLLCIALALAASVTFTRQRTDVYETSAKVLLRSTPAGMVDDRLVVPNLEAEAEIMLSDEVGAAVIDQLGLDEWVAGDSVDAVYVPESNVIEVTAKSASPARAADLANAYVSVYTAQRIAAQDEHYSFNLGSLTAEVAEVSGRIAADRDLVKNLDLQIGALEAQDESIDRNVQLAPLAADRAAAADRIKLDEDRLSDLRVQVADLTRLRDGGQAAGKVLSTANPPSSPQGIPDAAFWIVAGIFGLAVGSVLAFTRERLDRRAQNSRAVELALGGRVMGAVPRFSWRYRRGAWSLVMVNGRSSAGMQQAREAFRRLRGSLLFIARTDDVRVVVVTSSHPLEGKSTTAANLALALSLGGQSVALVSADLRRPSLEGLFGVANNRGLGDYLSGTTDELRTVRIPGSDRLDLVTAGPPVANPGELLGSRRFTSLLADLAEEYDLVIVDTPPLGSAADALSAATSAAGVIVVVDGRRTETPDLLSVRNELDRAGVRLLGAVLNRDRSAPRRAAVAATSSVVLRRRASEESAGVRRPAPGRAGRGAGQGLLRDTSRHGGRRALNAGHAAAGALDRLPKRRSYSSRSDKQCGSTGSLDHARRSLGETLRSFGPWSVTGSARSQVASFALGHNPTQGTRLATH